MYKLQQLILFIRRKLFGKQKVEGKAQHGIFLNAIPIQHVLGAIAIAVILGMFIFYPGSDFTAISTSKEAGIYDTFEQTDDVEENHFEFQPVLLDQEDIDNLVYPNHGLDIAYYNISRSMEIGAFREPYDKRHEQCKSVKYDLSTLERASIIIPFRNEPLVTMMRTLNSLFASVQENNLVDEIIIVHDGSDSGHKFKGTDLLPKYLPRFGPKLKYVEIPKKTGLVGARMRGFAEATAPVLVVLDIHIELGVNWLPPLLNYLKTYPKGMAVPRYDTINKNSFKISKNSLRTKGSLNIRSVTFTENRIRMGDLTGNSSNRVAPIRHSIACGGLFAMRRKWFEEIGYYDTEMHAWGFENIENSLRIWRCGGTIHMVPCSNMAHVYRDVNPNVKLPDEWAAFYRNKQRLIESWFEDYSLFVRSKNSDKKTENEDYSQIRSVQERLKCKDMKWWVDNIQPCSPMKLTFDLMKIKTPHRACEDDLQKSSVGEFDTAKECADFIKKKPKKCDTGYFMHSTNKDWGCRCCVNAAGNKNHTGWNIYSINAEERPKTEQERRGKKLIREERVDGECKKNQWTD